MRVAPLLATFVLSAFGARLLSRIGHRIARLDVPTDRSLHETPTPRSGGLAIVISAAVGVAMLASSVGDSSEGAWIVAAVAAVALVSYFDDRGAVHPAVRLGVHLAASAAAVLGASLIPSASSLALPIELPRPLLAAVLVVGVAWSINLYNFMDGMDGLAGGMAVFGFGTLAVLTRYGGAPNRAAVCAVLACAAAGFLTVNLPPARLFMGDVGSSTLGFAAATITLGGVRDGVIPAGAALILFSPFVIDATVTLVRRVLRRERVWQPHRTHFYQRLVRAGWGHRRTLIAEYMLMLLCSATAVVGTLAGVKWPPILGGSLAVYLALMAGVALVETRREAESHRAAPKGLA